MDRIAPTRRPEQSNDGVQSWRNLLFLHWPIDEEALRPLIPEELTIDTWEGQAYIGIVPFVMENVAPSWLPKLFAFNFLETNLRTYVHLNGEDPGVYFFSLDAASLLAVMAARLGWGLPYFYASMNMHQKGEDWYYSMTRRTGERPAFSAHYTVGEELGASEPGTFEFFLLERYLLYSHHRGNLMKGQVHHVPYPARKATVHSCTEGLIAAAGLPASSGLPPIVHYSEGVDVEVFGLKPIKLLP